MPKLASRYIKRHNLDENVRVLGQFIGNRIMRSDPDQYLNRLVVSALTVFVVVSLLLAAFVAREIWLQQRVVELSSDLQINLEELEQTTEEIQSKMSEMGATTQTAPEAQEWDDVNELLDDVDQQLESIEETIDDVAIVSEDAISIMPVATGEPEQVGDENTEAENTSAMRAQADQVFTIFAVLTGFAAIAIAVLLGMALRVQDSRMVI